MGNQRRWIGAVTAALAVATAPGCEIAPDDDEPIDEEIGTAEQAVSAPLPHAYCSIPVIGKGTKDMEKDYLPHVVTCENGGADLEALKAQAIAARSVAYYNMATQGKICDSQGCQVYSCGAQASEKAKKAVEATKGIYLSHAGMLTYGFYVAGDSGVDPPSCKGNSNVGTEHFVTYNQGKTGGQVKQTSLGFIGPPNYGQNRGCMSQWGARCLEKHKDFSSSQILQFYYGADIGMPHADAACTAVNDKDKDGVTDSKDNCKNVKNPAQLDTDKDGKGDACDADDDADTIQDAADNCPKRKNPGQLDTDGDDKGDTCDADDDNDKVADADDNCPKIANKGQIDTDGDDKGDKCDDDDDGDGVLDPADNCPKIKNAPQLDTDADGKGDKCELDDDADGFVDEADVCPKIADPDQIDLDGDGIGDACDDDDDGDGVFDVSDNCPEDDNAGQEDENGNGLGNICDLDADGDGFLDVEDACPSLATDDNVDSDEDGLGDACDDDIDGDGLVNEADAVDDAQQDGEPPAGSEGGGCSAAPAGGGWGAAWAAALALVAGLGAWRRRPAVRAWAGSRGSAGSRSSAR
jgi:MYXO-CTERM domain-containing protein